MMYLYLYLFSIHNIPKRDTEYCHHTIYTNNKIVVYKTIKI
jgi:hypothetical protein